MDIHNDVDKKETHIEKRTDPSAVQSTLIRYVTYIIIFFGVMYFLVQYILPKF